MGFVVVFLFVCFLLRNVYGGDKAKYRSGAEMEETKEKKERIIAVTSFLEQK